MLITSYYINMLFNILLILMANIFFVVLYKKHIIINKQCRFTAAFKELNNGYLIQSLAIIFGIKSLLRSSLGKH